MLQFSKGSRGFYGQEKSKQEKIKTQLLDCKTAWSAGESRGPGQLKAVSAGVA